uniref:interleukin-17C-like n=1 Tax=Myxine glutinosa TaxID=7769 RepID=UPI00358FFD13
MVVTSSLTMATFTDEEGKTGGACRELEEEERLLRKVLPARILNMLELAPSASTGSQHSDALPNAGDACSEWSSRILKSTRMSDRSLSPWHFRINYDPDRVPARLPEAKCLCLGCLNPQDGHHELGLSSVAVKTAIRVFRRQPCGAGLARYTPHWEHIAIACTCVNPHTGQHHA